MAGRNGRTSRALESATRSFFVDIFELFEQTLHSAFSRPSLENGAIRSVLLKQVYFTGFEAWKIIVSVALILGTVIVSQVVGVVGGGTVP